MCVLALALMFVAVEAFSEGDPNTGGPAGPKGKRGDRGGWIGTAGGQSVAYANPSKLDMLADVDSWIYTGQVPRVYKILNMTEEQNKAVEALMAEAKNAWQEMQKKAQETFRQTKDPAAFKDMQTQMEELKKTYQTRIGDVLTQEQKDLLAKIQAVIKERQDQINAIYQEANTKVQELRAAFDEKLAGVLTPEQLKLLDELMKPQIQKTEQNNPRPQGPGAAPGNGVDVAF
jgi:hypothetical protein